MSAVRTLSFDPLWKKLIDAKLTRTELAEKAGISRTTIAKMGKNEPVGLDIVLKVANVLDCDVIDILSMLPEGQ